MADSVETLCDAVRDDIGIGWLAQWLVNDDLRSGQLQRVLPRLSPHGVDAFQVWPVSKVVPLKVRLVVAHLMQEIGVSMRF